MRAAWWLAPVAAFAAACAAAQSPSPPSATVQEVGDEPSPARALALERQRRFAAAADVWLELVRREPMRHDHVVAAGRCLGRSGRFAEAVDLLQAARGRFPGSVDVDKALAEAFLLMAESPDAVAPEVRWADAMDLAEGVLQVDPDDEESRLILAQATYLLGDWQRAVREAEEAVRRHPQRSGAHILLGRIATDRFVGLLRQHAAGDLEPQAEADLVAAIDVQRQLARRSYARAAELEPDRAHPHVLLGELARLDHDTPRVRGHLLDALAIDPDVALDHRAIADGLDWRQRRDAYAGVRQRYDARAGATPQKRATLHFYEALASFEGGDWQAAQQAFAAALADNPAATNCHYYLALCHYRLGDHDAATREAATYAALGAVAFADVVRALPGETRGEIGAIVQFLADRAYRNGDLAASRDLNHVIACLSDSADAWNNHAFLCRETGAFAAALASYRHALEKEPGSPQLLNDTAVVLQYHLPTPEHLAEARSLYQRAIRRADEVLADRAADTAARESAQQARADATKNLAVLGE